MKKEYNLFEEGFLTTIQTDYYRKSYRDGETVYEPYSGYYPTKDCNYVHCVVEIDGFRVESVNLVKGKSLVGDTMSNLSPSNMDIVIDDPKVFEAMTKTVDEVIFNRIFGDTEVFIFWIKFVAVDNIMNDILNIFIEILRCKWIIVIVIITLNTIDLADLNEFFVIQIHIFSVV